MTMPATATHPVPAPNPWALADLTAPLYLVPPSTPDIRSAMRRGELAAILSPAAGNRLPDGVLFAADNSAFTGHYPGDAEYLSWLEGLAPHADRALWVTAPDCVADHYTTWARSRDVLPAIRDLGFPAAFVAQDGMEYDHSYDLWESFDVLFLGGTTTWKLGPAAADLVSNALQWDKCVHLGRVNSLKRLRYADYIGADTADGTYLTYGPDRLLPTVRSWVRQLRDQTALF
ncbi:hypothetical protein GCM10010411_76780 [Actinomadura fulvescens]|uniref:Uncharacterized protein n=1 Tax=Actinomadura fulvescens TaxID=46160 RepID=A0ABP6CZA2_9ACTN